MVRSPILWKLFATYVALAAICLAGAGYATHRVLVDYTEHEIERGLLERARTLAPILEPSVKAGAADLESRIRGLGREIGTRITIIRSDGVVIAESDRNLLEVGNHSDRPEFRRAMQGEVGTDVRRSVTVDRDLLYVAVPMGGGAPPAAVLRLAVPVETVRRTAGHIRQVIVWAGLLGLFSAVLLGFFVARRLTRPLEEMTAVASRYTDGDFRHRVRAGSRDEIGELGRALNVMGEELDRKIHTIERDREETRTLLSAMAEGVVAVDSDRRILFVNDAARRIFRLEAASLQGRDLTQVVRNSQVLEAVTTTLEHERPTTFEVQLPDGKECILEGQTAPVGGRRGGCVIVFHDISQIRKLENVRRDFVANVSHELRTPLTSIKGYVETLLSGGMDDREHSAEFLKKVASNADRLHALITDLLSLSRLESQAEPYVLVPVTLRGLIERSVASLRDRAIAKRMAIEIRGDLSGVRVLGDEGGLRQVLDNLLDNAIKYTPEGGRVSVEIAADGKRVRLAVQDTGIGIPDRDLHRIFERFYRVDRARSRELGGTGLGLAIVKHVVQALHGTIEVTSEVGKGTRFVVTLVRALDVAPRAGDVNAGA